MSRYAYQDFEPCGDAYDPVSTCGTCDGYGTVPKDGDLRECPECHGRGVVGLPEISDQPDIPPLTESDF